MGRTSRLTVPLSRASLLARTENRLTVTGSTVDVEAFKSNACGVTPSSLSFLPRGLLFGKAAAPPPLTFQRLLPVTQPVTDPEELLTLVRRTGLEPQPSRLKIDLPLSRASPVLDSGDRPRTLSRRDSLMDGHGARGARAQSSSSSRTVTRRCHGSPPPPRCSPRCASGSCGRNPTHWPQARRCFRVEGSSTNQR